MRSYVHVCFCVFGSPPERKKKRKNEKKEEEKKGGWGGGQTYWDTHISQSKTVH